MNYILLSILIIIILVPMFYITHYVVTLFYRCVIADRSMSSLKPTFDSWVNPFKSYDSHGRLIIL